MSLRELLFKNSNNNESEFIHLVEKRKDILYKTAFIYVRKQEDALDILQEAIYKAYMSYSKLKKPQYFNTWITKILINCAIDHLRKNKKRVELSNMVALETQKHQIDREQIMDIYTAIDKLNDKQKTIIILMYFNGFTLSEISEIVECPLGTVKSNLHKALSILRNELMEECKNDA